MMSTPLLPLLLLLRAVLSSAQSDYYNHLVIVPQSPKVEIGTNFTATCLINNTDEITADDLVWILASATVPREQYTRLNATALNVTILITGEQNQWLYCRRRDAPEDARFFHAIMLYKGYRPSKPENLSCVAVQEGATISSTISCQWEAAGRSTTDVKPMYNLTIISTEPWTVQTDKKSAQVNMEIFPFHVQLDIWVTAHNALGKVESEHLRDDAGLFAKPDPPSDVKVNSEKGFPTSFLINWSHPIAEEYFKLTYQIRFCQNGSQSWIYVPFVDTDKNIQSFRLQNLQPDTVYITQVRCRNAKTGSYWSEWSSNATKRTPEDRPASKPLVWKRIEVYSDNVRRVQLICKDPQRSNGRITSFRAKIVKDMDKNMCEDLCTVNRSEDHSGPSKQSFIVLKELNLGDNELLSANVTAVNSVGESPPALLIIPVKGHEPPPVEDLKVWTKDGQMLLEWRSPRNRAVSEFVVEWLNQDHIDWQRESRGTNRTVIRGNLEKFVCYTVSVYPVYSGRVGKPASIDAYLEQGEPLEGPAVMVNGKPGRNEAKLVWQVPRRTQGFITNYTIFYETETHEKHNTTVPGNVTSYTLTSLLGNTKYDTRIAVSTIRGSKNGSLHSFTTLKYASGEIEGIVVGACLGFLFIFVLAMLLCFYKKDAIKKNFWPPIPNPGNSTIGSWTLDDRLKVETPKESCVTGISVMDVDLCDGKCAFDEDKASLPLKKDKYLSEEHSSGIGGSSCMSSPRQSVSDSDEGSDVADTTASTVQYSSVVASSGYKGQTPGLQPPQQQQPVFSRSESTQPLLDSEENPDTLLPEGSRQCSRFPQQPCFMRLDMEQQEPLDFCPLEEDAEQAVATDQCSADVPTAAASSYMPQRGGYRPQ